MDDSLECTVCAEPIDRYEPEYFNGVEMNPACNSCKTPSFENQILLEEPSIDVDTTIWNPSKKDSSMNSPTNLTAFNTLTLDSGPAFHSSTLGTSLALNSLSPITLEHNPLHPTANESNNAPINTLDKGYDDYEENVRRKALILVKKKIEQRLKDVEIDDEALVQLEKELLEDLEDTIQENLVEYRNPHSIP